MDSADPLNQGSSSETSHTDCGCNSTSAKVPKAAAHEPVHDAEVAAKPKSDNNDDINNIADIDKLDNAEAYHLYMRYVQMGAAWGGE